MNHVIVFLIGVGSPALASLAAVVYLTPALRQILIDLCGTAERANFWTVFTNLAFILTPLIFALHQIPQDGSNVPLMLQLSSQLKWALIGLVLTLLIVGLVISRFIPRPQRFPTAANKGER